ncbi:MAG TPA: sigma-70 family RNA polymerase sigma factor, partial [Planctomycetota bacterium]|nr:sigma-70 family RNA polymerase sigma factor [Planctomycetota bacterium]
SEDTVLASWLFKVAQFAARNAIRARHRRTAHEREAPMSQHHEAHWDDLKPYLDAALASLPDVQRDAVVLRYMKGLTRADVAREMRCPERTVQTRLSRAMESLRGFLQRRGIAAPMAVLGTLISANSVHAAPAGLSATVTTNCVAASGASAAALSIAEMTAQSLAWAKAKTFALTAAIVLVVAAPVSYVAATQIPMLFAKAPPPAAPTPAATPAVKPAAITGFFVAANGTAAGDGSEKSPWDLATALAQPAALKAGQTVWLKGGTYSGNFVSKLAGAAGQPIVLRALPAERVTLRGTEPLKPVLSIEGSHACYWGFEVTRPGPRVSQKTGAWPDDVGYGGGVNVDKADHIKLINLVVHDVVGGGMSLWQGCTNSEVSGCVIYNCGWTGADRGHGPGLLVQNNAGHKKFTDNIVFQNFSSGVLAYGSDQAFVRDMKFEGNIFFNNGTWGKGGGIDFLLGGGSPAEKITFTRNYTYSPGTSVDLGYNDSNNKDCSATENTIVGGVRVQRWETLSFISNTIVGTDTAVQLSLARDNVFPPHIWKNNRYYIQLKQWQPFNITAPAGTQGLSYDDWRLKTNYDAGSRFSDVPVDSQVVVRPNAHEPGRAHICVYNWTQKKNVSIDVASFLKRGTRYEIRSALDYFGKPVWEGTCEGSTISFPLVAIRATPPEGSAIDPPPADMKFHAFVLIPKAQ